jgi:antirestriction protein ArdC
MVVGDIATGWGRGSFLQRSVPRADHWSGHNSRLDRYPKNRFGSRSYAGKELIAELGAAFLCAEFGFDGDICDAGYIAT